MRLAEEITAIRKMLSELEDVLSSKRRFRDKRALAPLEKARRALEAAHWQLLRVVDKEMRREGSDDSGPD
jgi:hypothetical protein